MADRNAPATFTFEEWRVEFNELASDVGDILFVEQASGILASATDIVECITLLNSNIIDKSSAQTVGGVKTFSSQTVFSSGIQVDTEGISNVGGTVTVTLPNTSGVLALEGFSIAMAVALG